MHHAFVKMKYFRRLRTALGPIDAQHATHCIRMCPSYLRLRLAALCKGAVLHSLPLYYGAIVAVSLWGMSSLDICHCEALYDVWDQPPKQRAIAWYSDVPTAALF